MPNLGVALRRDARRRGLRADGRRYPEGDPGVLDALAEHKPASMKFDASGLPAGETEYLTLDPREHGADRDNAAQPPEVPADRLVAYAGGVAWRTRPTAKVDGFVFEAPRRGRTQRSPRGELQAERSRRADLRRCATSRLRKRARPRGFRSGWPGDRLRGRACARRCTPEPPGFRWNACSPTAKSRGWRPRSRSRSWPAWRAREGARAHGSADLPDGFPRSRSSRWRAADSRTPTASASAISATSAPRSAIWRGSLDYRCPAEPVEDFVAKGGTRSPRPKGAAASATRLLANIGHGQARPEGVDEKPLLTSGDDLVSIWKHLGERARYAASDVVDYLLSGVRRA